MDIPENIPDTSLLLYAARENHFQGLLTNIILTCIPPPIFIKHMSQMSLVCCRPALSPEKYQSCSSAINDGKPHS